MYSIEVLPVVFENMPLRQSSDVMNELLVYDVGWRLSLFAQAEPDEWVSDSGNCSLSHQDSHALCVMSENVPEALNVCNNVGYPPYFNVPAPSARVCTYHYLLPILPKQQPGGQSTPGLCGMWWRGKWRSQGEYNIYICSFYLRRR